MADILNKIKIGVSPLTNHIMMYRMGKSTTDALESRDITGMAFGGVIEHMMDGFPNGSEKIITSGDNAWKVTVVPVKKEETL